MRISHAPSGWTRLPSAEVMAGRYRVDFFSPVNEPVPARGQLPDVTWWQIERVYIDGDAAVTDVLDWCEEHSGADAAFALYSETRVGSCGEETILVELLAGEDPTPRLV
jgi:hypothetical protein